MIHVCYSMRDENGLYSKHVAASMLSLFENTKESVTIHLLHDSTFTDELRKKFLKLVYTYEQDIKFYNVEELFPEQIESAKKMNYISGIPGRVSILYRLMIPDVVQESKIIYLDADTIVNLDINELWSTDLQNHPLGAITDFSVGMNDEKLAKLWWLPYRDGIVKDYRNYFNSGVLYMNLEKIRDLRGGGGIIN